MILTMYLASRGATSASRGRRTAALAAGPRTAAMARKASSSSLGVMSSRVRREGKNVSGYGSRVAETAVGVRQSGAGLAGKLFEQTPDEGTSDLQGGLVVDGEGAAGEEDGGGSGVLGRESGKQFDEDGGLFEALSGGSDTVGGGREQLHVG